MHYLDHAATTPLRPAAREAWLAAAGEPGNPSSVHGAGRRSRAILEDAREQVAALLGAHPTEVIFTSGATEANNLALASARGAVVSTAVEHHSVLDPAKALGATLVGVDSDGVVDLDRFSHALEGARLASVQWVNNEVGTIQPIAEIVAAASAAGVPAHSDAVQAVGHVPIDFAASGLAMMSVSAHKVGGPVGIGALLARRDVRLEPLARGGGQQRGRSGTLDAAGASAFSAALAEAVGSTQSLDAEAARLADLREALIEGISAIEGARVTGGASVSPHIVNVILPGTRAESVLFGLDQAGIEVSSGSACTAGVVDASHVLLAMGEDATLASAAIRVSTGWTTTRADVDALLAALPRIVEAARTIR